MRPPIPAVIARSFGCAALLVDAHGVPGTLLGASSVCDVLRAALARRDSPLFALLSKALESEHDIFSLKITDIMNPHPTAIVASEKAVRALEIMRDRNKINDAELIDARLTATFDDGHTQAFVVNLLTGDVTPA